MIRSLALVAMMLGIPALAPEPPLGHLGRPRVVPADFVGPDRAVEALDARRAEPLSMASADFDEDGMPDLLVAYSWADGPGAIALYRGNVDAVYPNEPAARQRRASGTFVGSPFLPDVVLFETPERGDLIGAGDFDADGHRDAIVARRGGTALFWHRGDGRGALGEAVKVTVPGPIAAMAVGDVNRRDGLEDIVVAIETASGGGILAFEGLTGALASAPEEIPLKTRPSDIVLGRLDDDAFLDLAIAAGRNLDVIRGRDRGLFLDVARRAMVAPPAVLTAPLPFTLQSLALGEFDDKPGADLALLDSSRRLGVLRADELFADPSAAVARLAPVNVDGGDAAGDSSAVRLIRARVTAAPGDDLILMDPARAGVMSRRPAGEGQNRHLPFVRDLGAARAALGMRLGPAALDGLVLLIGGEALPRAMDIGPMSIFQVTTIADSGPGSLRQAILDANATTDLDTIEFDIPGSGPHTITPATPLPHVMHPTIIDGTTEPDYATAPVVRLDGNLLTDDILRIRGGSSTVRGLSMGRQGGDGVQAGIYLSDAGGNVVEGNLIGTNTAGTAPGPTFGHGIVVTSFGNTIGGTSTASRNVVSGNDSVGILVQEGGDDTSVLGNYVGLNVAGTGSVPNGNGINLDHVETGTIGGLVAGSRNVVANPNFDIMVGVQTISILVQGNYVGTNDTGMATFGLHGNGIAIRGSSYATVGGWAAGARNVVAGHDVNGIEIRPFGLETRYNNVVGNFIGVAANGFTALGNGTGIRVEAGPDNFIGSSLTGGRNVISGNSLGIVLDGIGGNDVAGNYIGLSATGLSLVPNDTGVVISSPDNRIGGTVSGAGNIVSGNSTTGISFVGTTISNILVEGNRIGTDPTGALAFGNGVGVSITNGAAITIGGVLAESANLIAHNGGPGVVVNSSGPIEIRGNSIDSNGGLGIDLAGDGVTLNDAVGDMDTGPNGLQNFPVINVARSSGTSITVSGTLNSTPGISAAIDVYVSSLCDPLGYGEGATLLGSDTTTLDGSGAGFFSLTVPAGAFEAGDTVTATATAAGMTSEFSACRAIAGVPPEAVTGLKFETSPTEMLSWDPADGASLYHIYVGTRATLPGLATQAPDSCTVGAFPATSLPIPPAGNPPPGEMFWAMVTAEGPYGEGPLQPGSNGPRQLTSLGPCGDSCAHDVCSTGGPLQPACTFQASFVCAKDPSCCDQGNGTWDFPCVQQVRTVGRSLLCPESQGQCAHTLCNTGQPLQPSCDTPPLPVSCTAMVCQADPHCCQSTWDDACIAKVASICGYNCV